VFIELKQRALIFFCASVIGVNACAALEKQKPALPKNTMAPILHVHHWVSASGVPVYWVPIPGLPIVDMRLFFDAGSSRDGHKLGLAFLTSRLLMTGTKSYSVDQIAERLDNVGAVYGFAADRDATVLAVRTRMKVLPVVLSTFQDVLGHPIFPQDQFKRVKKETLQGVKAGQQYPSVIASQRFFKLLYGNAPYGHPVNGTLDTVKPLTRQDVISFYKHYYSRKNAKLVLVGAVTRSQAEMIANRLVSALQEGKEIAPLPEVLSTSAKPTVQHVPFPATQSTVYMGHIGINFHDPDYAALRLGNHIFGASSLVSRLFKDVRDKHGFVYNVGSYFSPLQARGPFLIGLKTRTSKKDAAIKQVRTTLDTFLREGPTESELEQAKKNIVGGFIVDHLTSNGAITNIVSTLVRYHLPLNYFDTYLARIQSLSPQQVLSAFKRHVHPDQFVTVIVGQG